MEQIDLEKRMKRLERRIVYLAILSGAVTIILATVSLGAFSRRVKAAEASQILRVRGIIVEDAQGRSRILIGAPVPSVPDRLRKDSHTTSIVFLDDKGHDRFLLGEMVSASPSFHRIAASYGLTIYDPDGHERGGMGFLSNGTTVSRAAIVLDRPGTPSTPGDAWGAMVDDKTGFAGTGYMYAPEIGHGNEAILIGTQGRKAFVNFKAVNRKDRSSFALDPDGTASFHLYQNDGTAGPNLLESAQ